MAQRDDALAGFAEAHVISVDGAPPGQEEGDALVLMRKESVRELERILKCRVLDFGGR